MFAVIKTGGKQYKVAAEDVIKVELLAGEAGDSVEFSEVLMVSENGTTTVGAPFVEGATVAGEVVAQARGRKIIIFKKRRRKNSRRRNGHRQAITVVKITDILTGGAKPKAAKKAEPEPEEVEATPVEEVVEAPAEAVVETAPSEDTAVTALFDVPEGDADDLKKISGVGPVLEKKLNALGITQYQQVAAFSQEDIDRVDEVLNFKGRIEREGWVDQAKALAAGETPGE